MANSATYFEFLNKLKGNHKKVADEKRRLEAQIKETRNSIRKSITPENASRVLLDLIKIEIDRSGQFVGLPISDFAGQAAFLQAICASIPFQKTIVNNSPPATELLEKCDLLWKQIFFREMIEDLGDTEKSFVESQQFVIASSASLLEAFQRELRYPEQVAERAKRIFSSFSKDIIEPELGISVADSIRGLNHIKKVTINRMIDIVELNNKWTHFKKEFEKHSAQKTPNDQIYSIFSKEPWFHALFDKDSKSPDQLVTELLLFNEKDFEPILGNRSNSFLEAFSFIPGKENLDYILPGDPDIVRSHPFAKMGSNQYFLMELTYCNFAIEHRLTKCFNTQKKKDRLNKKRDKTLESEAISLFSTLLEPDEIFSSYFLPVGKNGVFAERDLLIQKEDCIFIIESKARALRSVVKRRDKLSRVKHDIKCSIQGGYDQACSVINHLKNSGKHIELFDSEKSTAEVIATLDLTEVKHFIPIVFLDSYYGMITTDLKPWLSPDPSIGFPWVIDRDTLETMCLKLNDFVRFKDFVSWRRQLHGIAVNEDELVFAGFYLKHGSAKFPKDDAHVMLSPDYTDVFEAEYARRNGIPVDMPSEEVRPPVWSVMHRDGDIFNFQIDGKLKHSINLQTGEDIRVKDGKRLKPSPNKVGRNEACPCGSGKKYKKCCLNHD